MKNESKTSVTKHLCHLMMVPLLGWSISSVMAEDTVTKPPASDTPPVVAPGVTTPDTDTGKANPAMDAERIKQLSATYGVTEQQVLTMRQTDHMGWGEIKNLLLISQRVAADSAKTTTPLTKDQALTQVLKQRQSGMGIGQIANSYNVKLGDLQKGDKLDKIAKPDKPDKISRPDKPDRPERMNRPDKPERPDKPNKK